MLRRFLPKLNRRHRRKHLLVIISIVFIILYLLIRQEEITLPPTNENDVKKQIIDFINSEKDENVDTYSYLKQFNNYNEIKKEFQINSFKKIYKKESINENNSRQLNKSEYLILEYTKFWRQTKFCKFFEGSQQVPNPKSKVFVKECPYTNCRFTCDKKKTSEADALLFHEADVNEEQVNNKMYIKNVAKLHMQRPDQLFLLWNDEANKVKENLDEIRFNWTLSYRLDSEVSDCAYGCSYKKSISKNLNNELMQNFVRRKNQALWFVSNCDSNYRINFALDVEKYLPVKIYGACKLVTKIKKVYI